jgi:hypothetical protein
MNCQLPTAREPGHRTATARQPGAEARDSAAMKPPREREKAEENWENEGGTVRAKLLPAGPAATASTLRHTLPATNRLG